MTTLEEEATSRIDRLLDAIELVKLGRKSEAQGVKARGASDMLGSFDSATGTRLDEAIPARRGRNKARIRFESSGNNQDEIQCANDPGA